jgi:hypothetical protein
VNTGRDITLRFRANRRPEQYAQKSSLVLMVHARLQTGRGLSPSRTKPYGTLTFFRKLVVESSDNYDIPVLLQASTRLATDFLGC